MTAEERRTVLSSRWRPERNSKTKRVCEAFCLIVRRFATLRPVIWSHRAAARSQRPLRCSILAPNEAHPLARRLVSPPRFGVRSACVRLQRESPRAARGQLGRVRRGRGGARRRRHDPDQRLRRGQQRRGGHRDRRCGGCRAAAAHVDGAPRGGARARRHDRVPGRHRRGRLDLRDRRERHRLAARARGEPGDGSPRDRGLPEPGHDPGGRAGGRDHSGRTPRARRPLLSRAWPSRSPRPRGTRREGARS